MPPLRLIPIRKGDDLAVSVGQGISPALVFLHGALGNRCNWRSQLQSTERQGWQALAYDLGGHGQSSVYRRYSIGRHCRLLSRLPSQLSISDPILCCHRYEVPIGLELASRHRATGLVLITGGTDDLDPWWESPLMTLMALGLRHLFYLPALQRWTQLLISSYRTPLLERYILASLTPTDYRSCSALDVCCGYHLFCRLRHAEQRSRCGALS
ncbi:MAG: alpha/beta fold hydrolase [Synechococcaceae cyanobacterium]